MAGQLNKALGVECLVGVVNYYALVVMEMKWRERVTRAFGEQIINQARRGAAVYLSVSVSILLGFWTDLCAVEMGDLIRR